jgi:hypothetical protein
MTVVEQINLLAERAGILLVARIDPARPGFRQSYVFCLLDGTEYATFASLKDGRREIVRLLKLYGPTLKGPGFANGEELQAYLCGRGLPRLIYAHENLGRHPSYSKESA